MKEQKDKEPEGQREPKVAPKKVRINAGGGKWVEIAEPKAAGDIPAALALSKGAGGVVTVDGQKFRF